MVLETGSRRQCCDYLEEEYLNLIDASHTNRSELLNRLLAAYFDGHNDIEVLDGKIARGEADIAVWRMQREELVKHQGGDKLEDSFRDGSRDELWNGYLTGERHGKDLVFNLNWLGGPGMKEKVRLAGFRSSRECLTWLEKKFNKECE